MKINSFKKSTKTPSNKMRRIRLFFNQEDKNTIKKWFGCARKTYNWALSCIKNNRILLILLEGVLVDFLNELIFILRF